MPVCVVDDAFQFDCLVGGLGRYIAQGPDYLVDIFALRVGIIMLLEIEVDIVLKLSDVFLNGRAGDILVKSQDILEKNAGRFPPVRASRLTAVRYHSQ